MNSHMRDKNIFVSFIFEIFLLCFFLTSGLYASQLNKETSKQDESKGAYYTNKYENLFVSLLNKSESEVKAKIDSSFNQLFYGEDSTQRVYYPVNKNMAYIKDINNGDVRTEGMSYGMMIAVQLNKKIEFDRIWKWAKTYMQFNSGQREGYFAWHCRPDGSVIDSNSASDGEEWFVMSLFFASSRWGNGKGIFNYKAEAQNILNAMLSKKESSNRHNVVTNMFNKKEKKVVFVPSGNVDDFTDPSYHLPHYYELWGRWADNNNKFWSTAADTSRMFLKRAVNPATGLAPTMLILMEHRPILAEAVKKISCLMHGVWQ